MFKFLTATAAVALFATVTAVGAAQAGGLIVDRHTAPSAGIGEKPAETARAGTVIIERGLQLAPADLGGEKLAGGLLIEKQDSKAGGRDGIVPVGGVILERGQEAPSPALGGKADEVGARRPIIVQRAPASPAGDDSNELEAMRWIIVQ